MRPCRFVSCLLACCGSAALLLACGGDDDVGLGASTSGGGSAGAGGATSSGGSGGSAGLAGANGGGEGGASGAAGGGGSTNTEPIDPITVGRTWTYEVQMIGVYPTCPSGTSTSKALSSKQLDGKEAITVSSLCALAGNFDYSVDGDRVYSYFDGAWRLSLDAPVEAAHEWSDGFSDYRWEKAPDGTVGAETVRDCWSARKLGANDTHTVFCRGVGPVRWHYEDGFGNGYDAVLTSYGK